MKIESTLNRVIGTAAIEYTITPEDFSHILNLTFHRAFSEALVLPEEKLTLEFNSDEVIARYQGLEVTPPSKREFVSLVRGLLIKGLQEHQVITLYNQVSSFQGQLATCEVTRTRHT